MQLSMNATSGNKIYNMYNNMCTTVECEYDFKLHTFVLYKGYNIIDLLFCSGKCANNNLDICP